MLRFMTLRLETDVRCEATSVWQTVVLEATRSVWAEFLQSSSEQHSLTFPALEDLCLDFSAWRLEKSNASKLRVCALSQSSISPWTYAQCLPQVEPFLRKLRPSGGLRRLLISDLGHEQNLNDFKHGFVKEGGRFQAVDKFDSYDPDHQTILADEIVSYSNLHTLSKGVRTFFGGTGCQL